MNICNVLKRSVGERPGKGEDPQKNLLRQKSETKVNFFGGSCNECDKDLFSKAELRRHVKSIEYLNCEKKFN